MEVIRFVALGMVSPVLLAGCQNEKSIEQVQPRQESAAQAPAVQSVATNPLLNQWLGKWAGPEGTFLELSREGGEFVVKINSLDGPAIYEGTGAGDHIEFQRNGNTESIHAGNGEDTGMKWLLDKKDCLVIKKGEGFCR